MPSITLPNAYMVNDTPDPEHYITDLISFITSPLPHSIFTSHINSIAAADDSEIPEAWDDWWKGSWLDAVDFKEIVTAIVQNDELPEHV